MMKCKYAIEKLAVCVAIILALGATNVLAQGRVREAEAHSVLKVRELTGYGPRGLVKSPDAGMSKRAAYREWAELSIQYDTEPEWLDEVVFNYYVLVRGKTAQDFTLLKGVVTYVDVARGAKHMGVAYVRPAALARFGEIVGVAVEAKVKGETVSSLAEGRLGTGKPLPVEWWKNPNLASKEGYILDKSKTPFALLSFDDYEALK
ncbi:MAG: Amuc_1102 family pilus-like protein [bacterium]